MTVSAGGSGGQPLARKGLEADAGAEVRTGPALVLEASTLSIGVALLGPDGEPWGAIVAAPDARGTSLLAAAAAELLAARSLTVAQLGGVIVGTGPGSYTGVRAAIALARALAWAARLRIVGVPSVAGAALGELRRRPDVQRVIVLIDARRDECYRADYERASVGVASDAGATSAGTGAAAAVGAGAVLREVLAPCLVAGAETLPVATFIDEPGISVLREPHPDAYDVGAVGRERLLSGGDSPDAVLPLYLKRSHAEIVFDERVGSQGLGGG